MITVTQPDGRTRMVQFAPGYDKRPRYGIHGMHINFALVSPIGAVVFDAYTAWYPRTAEHEWDTFITETKNSRAFGWGISWHGHKPSHNDEGHIGECEFLGGKCHNHELASTTVARNLFAEFCTKGEDVVWEYLNKTMDEQERKALEECQDNRNFN